MNTKHVRFPGSSAAGESQTGVRSEAMDPRRVSAADSPGGPSLTRRRFLRQTGLCLAGAVGAGGAVSTARVLGAANAARTRTAGPLRVHPQNRRYFADATGRPVYLTGAHTWNNLSDVGPGNPPAAFDFPRYLDFLERHHHNFIRLWRWELTRWDAGATPEYTAGKDLFTVAPHPWRRTGPGMALDGGPRFDLDQFDPAYFDRLRRRVRAAQDRGIYVGIMLFEGWGLQHLPGAWASHPFHPANNLQGLDGDAGGDGRGLITHTLKLPEVTRRQEAYIRQVVRTVQDLDNVLYEISNECGAYSLEWQYHLIRFLHACEQDQPQQHPVGITFLYSRDGQQRGTNAQLFDSPADWISPNPEAADGYNYRSNPPPADGRKVVLSDTDHLWGIGGSPDWVWKTFLRGHQPLFMDPYDNRVLGKVTPESWDPVRQALGHARRLAERVDLTALAPRETLASTRFCLADPGRQYLAYLPEDGEIELDLSAATGSLAVEWTEALTGTAQAAEPAAGGGLTRLRTPFRGPSAVWVRQDARTS